MANCPKCGGHVSHLATEKPIGIMQIHKPSAVVYVCPDRNCRAILGIAVDMDEIERRTSAAITRAMKKRP